MGRGLFDMATLNAMHDKMHKAVNQLAGASTRCSSVRMRRTRAAAAASRAGMLLEIAERFKLELAGVPVIGDSCATAGCGRRRRPAVLC